MVQTAAGTNGSTGLTSTSSPSEIQLYLATLDEDGFYSQTESLKRDTHKSKQDLVRWFKASRNLLASEEEGEAVTKKDRFAWHDQAWEIWQQQYTDHPVIYISDTKEFFQYDRGTYDFLPEEALDQLLIPVFRKTLVPIGKNKVTPVIENQTTLNWFIRMLKGHVATKLKDVDAEPNIINFKNGLYHIDTDKVEPHRPTYLSFVQIQGNYDPAGPQSPRLLWTHLVTTSLPKMRDQEILRNLIRLSFNPFRGTKERETIFVGTGKNGKDQFEEVWRSFFQEMFVTQVTLDQLATYEFAKSFLLDMRLNMVGDAETATPLTDIGNFLDLTGKKFIVANMKNVKRPIRAPNRCRNVFAADRFMCVTNAQYGFWRRWQPLECTEKFDNHDEVHKEIPDLGSRIVQEEMDGVIQWVMAANPATFTDWYTPDEVKKMWTRGADPIRRFVEDHCRIGSLETVGADTFTEALAAFCTEIDQPLPSARAITITLGQDFHVPPKHDDHGSTCVKDRYVYHGIGLRAPIERTIEQLVSRLRHTLEDMGINMDLVEHGLQNQNEKDPGIKTDWKDAVSRLTHVLEKGPQKTPSSEIDARNLKGVVHTPKKDGNGSPPAEKKPSDINAFVTGHSRSQVSKTGKVLEVLHDMEEENNNEPVEASALKERIILDGGLNEEEIEDALKTLKKEGDLIYPKDGFVKSVTQ